MLSVLVVNDSERAALKKSQRVIAKYLPQVGPATYQGLLSAEGLADLERELQALRSRYLSVGGYLVAHDQPPTLCWVVGSKRNFDEESSLFAHRRRTLGPAMPAFKGTPTAVLLAWMLRLAALTHDLGKMNDAFQRKLWLACSKAAAGPQGEFLRHDALSYLILRELGWSLAAFERLAQLTPIQLEALVAAKSAAALRADFNEKLKADLDLLRGLLAPTTSRRRSATPAAPVSIEELVCRLVAFLSLTHHRLPGPARHDQAGDLNYVQSLSGEAYFNEAAAGDFADCLKFSGGNVFLQSPGLAQQLQQVLGELGTLTKASEAWPLQGLVRLVLAYGRPVLVLADHLASALKSGEPVAPRALLGNTVKPAEDSKPATPGDTLATHISSVYHQTRRQAQFALNLCANQDVGLPKLSLRAQRAIDSKRSRTGPFAWQGAVHEHLATPARCEPAFVVVTAGTGSGKTIASAQIMRALGSTRWTYCLGLRSLTLQTGRSYQEDLGLSEQDLAIVIGDPVAKKAFEQDQRRHSESGSESLTQEPEMLLTAESQADDWLRLMAGKDSIAQVRAALKSKKVDFAAAPVVVCTIDQLIGVTKLASVSKAFDYKRLQSADLVLDEVDNYSPEELKHIARLCYLVGLSRKNLVCLSATMGSLHVEALLESYRAGVALNHQLTGQGASLRFATAANTLAPTSCLLLEAASLREALAHNDAFNAAAMVEAARTPPKTKMRVLDCFAGSHGHILQEALRLHDKNAGEVEGARVSVGFVKLNTVGSARSLAKHLYETTDLPDDTEIAVLCYHAKHTGLELSLIDRALNTLTNRKKLDAGASFSTQAVKRYINPLLWAAQKPNLVLIVVTTSIIETGRDHDYDWAILEPSSHRSLVQALGRVRRHRGSHPAGDVENAVLLRYPVRACTAEGVFSPTSPVRVFSYPGPLSEFASKKFPCAVGKSYAELLALAQAELANTQPLVALEERDSCADGFASAYPGGVVRNAIALTPPAQQANSLALLEQYVLFKSLTEKAGGNYLSSALTAVAASAQLEKGMWLSSWAYRRTFRGDSAHFIEDQLYLMQLTGIEAKRFVVGSPLTLAGRAAGQLHLEEVTLARRSRSILLGSSGPKEDLPGLLADEAAALFKAGFSKWELMDFACYAPERYGTAPDKVFYNALLGFNAKSV